MLPEKSVKKYEKPLFLTFVTIKSKRFFICVVR